MASRKRLLLRHFERYTLDLQTPSPGTDCMPIHYTIFYSWQSDTAKKYNWSFIEKALQQAASDVKQSGNKHGMPTVDFGMERVAGSPEVATVMFRKIKSAAIFVG